RSHTEDRVADVQLRVTLDEDVRDQRAQILRGLLLRVDRRVASRRGSRRRARWPDWCCSPVATSERLRPRCPRTTACVGYLPCCAASSTTRGCRSTGWRRRQACCAPPGWRSTCGSTPATSTSSPMRRASRRRSYWLRWLSAARGTPFTLIFIADAGGSSLGYAPRRP